MIHKEFGSYISSDYCNKMKFGGTRISWIFVPLVLALHSCVTPLSPLSKQFGIKRMLFENFSA